MSLSIYLYESYNPVALASYFGCEQENSSWCCTSTTFLVLFFNDVLGVVPKRRSWCCCPTNDVLSVVLQPTTFLVLFSNQRRSWCCISTTFLNDILGVIRSVSYDRTARCWDMESGECLRVFRGHQRAIFTFMYIPVDDEVEEIDGYGSRREVPLISVSYYSIYIIFVMLHAALVHEAILIIIN